MKPLLPCLVAGAASLGALALPIQEARVVQEQDGYTDQLTKLAWMSGHWRARAGQSVQEESWLESRGNLMLGVHREHGVAKDRLDFEYLRIEVVGDHIVYQASPAGRAPTPFTLVHAGVREAVFENPDHDFPQRITYRRTGDVLTAEVGLLADDPALTFKWELVE